MIESKVWDERLVDELNSYSSALHEFSDLLNHDDCDNEQLRGIYMVLEPLLADLSNKIGLLCERFSEFIGTVDVLRESKDHWTPNDSGEIIGLRFTPEKSFLKSILCEFDNLESGRALLIAEQKYRHLFEEKFSGDISWAESRRPLGDVEGSTRGQSPVSDNPETK